MGADLPGAVSAVVDGRKGAIGAGDPRGAPGADPEARGLALVLVVALLLALTLLAHGALRLTRSEAVAARMATEAALDVVERRAVLRRVFDGGGIDSLRGALGHVDTLLSPAPGWSAHVTRGTRETGMLAVESSRAVGRGAPVRRRGHALLWSLEPIARVAGLRAAVAVGGEVRAPAGTVRSSGMYSASAEERPFCAALELSLDSLSARRPEPPPVASLLVAPPYESAAQAGATLGALPLDSLERRLSGRVVGTVSPRPATSGASCDTADSGNWGSPTDPTGPCGAYSVARVGEGSLVVEGGEGRGLLVVRGDLLLRDGARFAGLVLTGGSLRLTQGARITGAAIVAHDLELSADSRVTGSGCMVASVLSPWPVLRRAVRIEEPLLPSFF